MHEIRKDGDRELVRSWASDIERGTLRQAEKSARSPAVAGPVALMPDAHIGIGATIGSVIPTEGAIIPAAVGVDIGCGMIAVQTSLTASDLPSKLDDVLDDIYQAIPAGFAKHADTTKAAWRWLAANPVPRPSELTDSMHRKVGAQLGTLGSGNHFVEVCLDERQAVWTVLHSGSRGVGNTMATRHIRTAKGLCDKLHRRIEDRDLAYFLESDAEFQAYVDDMLWAQAYALENRALMMDALLGVVRKHIGKRFTEVERINAHHNYTTREEHDGRQLWITRKGAIRAQVGDRGVIPGSMGAGTFIVTGLGEPSSYHSASHGAGRRMGRKQAKRTLTTAQFKKAMQGRTWQAGKAKQLLDEAPMAYKDIDQVMRDQADLVQVDHTLQAVLNYKGT
ncbi:MAG: RtcB family protein [Actinobacteria bacterium]|nr:RtcB family protein [Actinomycetota bacterium]